MINSMPEENILYKAQNDRTVIYTITILLIILAVMALLLTIFYFGKNYMLGLFVFIYMAALITVGAFYLEPRFHTDRLFINSEGIFIKQNKEYRSIKFEEISNITRERVKGSSYSRMSLIIQKKTGEIIECMSIENFEYFIKIIKQLYPSFNDTECLKLDISSELNNLKSNFGAIILLSICAGLKIWGIKFCINKNFWIFDVLPSILLIIAYIPKYTKLKKKECEQKVAESKEY